MREYDLIAEWYETDRSRTLGVAQALSFAAALPACSRILDVGCGNGLPITGALVNAGHRLVGLDSSEGMLAHFRVNLPATPIVRGDARRCPFAEGSFDAAISWGMIFHLSPRDQTAVFAGVSRVLRPGAPFLFTATEIGGTGETGIGGTGETGIEGTGETGVEGTGETGIEGTMNGVTFRYYAVPSYRRLLAEHGMTIVSIFDDPGVSTWFLSRKS
jgi:SAM-dependent methyltransferase